MAETGGTDVGDLAEEKLYRQRARGAHSILVRQAKAGRTIQYGGLADELPMSNARNLTYVLGAIGNAPMRLSEK
ncbi:hypothetical protein JW905_17915 [bacterium]|nr:hypothetical protein [candidate division CSSED10-310 bacterium]